MNRHEKALGILHSGTVIPAIPLVLDKNRCAGFPALFRVCSSAAN